MTVKRTSLGDIVTTKFRTEPNELGVVETWEDISISTEIAPTDTQRMRLMSAKEAGVVWPSR